MGEVSKLYLISSKYVLTDLVPDSNFEVDFDDFSLESGKNFENIYFSPRSCNFSENQSIDNAGEIFSKEIGFRVPKNRSDVATWLYQNKHKRWTALVMTADGTWFLVTKNLVLKYKRIFPESSDKYNGWEVSITGKDTTASPVVKDVSL